MVPRSVQRGPTAPMREAVARANDVHRMQTGAGQSGGAGTRQAGRRGCSSAWDGRRRCCH